MNDPEVSRQLEAPYEERWVLLKPIMFRLYIDEKKKVKEIVKIMETEYKFFASHNQYKRQFGVWNFAKALPSKKKEKIAKVLRSRSRQGKSTVVEYNGCDQSKIVQRYLKGQMKQEVAQLPCFSLSIENMSGHALQCNSHLFMNWNMSPAVLALLQQKFVDPSSPSLQMNTPISGVEVFTPGSNSAPSPAPARQSGPALQTNKTLRIEQSSMMAVAHESLLSDRAHTFLTGDHMAFLGGMNLQEQIVTTDWLYQFWQFSFRTARTWGRGPRVWNSVNLGLERVHASNTRSSPNSGAYESGSPSAHSENPAYRYRSHSSVVIEKPSSECRWSIHVRPMRYQRVPSPPLATEAPVVLDEEETWKQWPTSESIEEFAATLQRNIENNNFSTIELNELPMAANQIARGLKRTPEQLLVEAFGFSIMARNSELVQDMLEKLGCYPNIQLNTLFPIHLAASYIDGSKTCCTIFDSLISNLSTRNNSVRNLYVNHLSHTVLDTLMISILKSHTSCVPGMVDDAFKKEHRFAGEEVDICGRWDADSHCIRQLQASGNSIIPRNWKHVFCHTSAQTMVHCMSTLFGPHWAPNINTPSGIFVKRCQNETCGLKMQLNPLHTLVVTAVHLAQYGSEGETLFGILACLLCLLSKGANPLLKAEISPMALLAEGYGQECTHSALDPLELAQHVPKELILRWTRELQTGWSLLCHILELSKKEWEPQSDPKLVVDSPRHGFQTLYSDFMVESGGILDQEGRDLGSHESDDDEMEYEDVGEDEDEIQYKEHFGNGLPAYCPRRDEEPWHQNFFRKNEYLSTLWAMVQTELLTYRRLKEGHPWVSEHFDMKSVLHSLDTGSQLSVGLISKGLMSKFCRCGIACSTQDPACVLREDACSEYFSNLEDWERTTFLEDLSSRGEFWY